MREVDYSIQSYFVEAMTVLAFALFFRSVWIRKGYAGKNRILEPHEVRMIYVHVGGAVFSLVVEVMIFSRWEFIWVAWTIPGAVIASVFGTEIYFDIKKATKSIGQSRASD